MPKNAAGVYTLPPGINPVVPGTVIMDTWANPTLSDMAQAITDSLDRYGRGGMLAAFKIASGTVALPGLAFTDEPATGIYRIGAGEMGFSVGGVKKLTLSAAGLAIVGSLTTDGNTILGDAVGDTLNVAGGSLQVSAAGLVGVGAAPVSSKFHVTTASAEALKLERGDNLGVYARWKRPNREYILALDIDNNGGTGFSIFDNTAGAERMRIHANGAVAIGIPAGSDLFNVGGNTNFGAGGGVLARQRAHVWSTHYAEWGMAADYTAYLDVSANGDASPISFRSAGAERMRISAAGNVGIGTSSFVTLASAAYRQLRVRGVGAGDIGSIVASGGTTGDLELWCAADGSQAGLFTPWAFPITFGNNATERMRITAGGAVLIGTASSPAYGSALRIQGTTEQHGNQFNFAGNAAVEIVNRANLGIDLYPTGAILGLRITAAGVIQDGAGLELGYRDVPPIAINGAHSMVGDNRGKCLRVDTSSTVTVPSGLPVGTTVSISNYGASAITIAQGAGTTLRLAGTTTTGNRTLARFGLATVFVAATNDIQISGAGVS